jgi:hypothetical protein
MSVGAGAKLWRAKGQLADLDRTALQRALGAA